MTDTDLTIEFDDEHPLFTLIWERSKTARRPMEPLGNGVPPSPELITLELRVGDTVQKFGLCNIADVSWSGNRMRMRTTWLGSPPTNVDTTTTPPSAPAQTGATPA